MKYPDREQAVNERSSKKSKTTNTAASVTINNVNPEQNRLYVAIIKGVQN